MKAKAGVARIPYRRGPDEEIMLQELRDLRAPNVPSLSSDNLWLRFSVHLLDALWEIAHGQPNARILIGEPGPGAHELRLMSAQDTGLSSKLGEARLLAAETAMLDRLRERLLSTSRSAMLRQALMTCSTICRELAEGTAVYVDCDGVPHALPDLVQLAAELGQPSDESRALCSHQVLSWPAEVRMRLGVQGKADYCRASALMGKLESGNYELACFELPLPELGATARCALRLGQEPRVELAPNPHANARAASQSARSDPQQIGRACPAPPGEWSQRGPSDALGVGEQSQCVLP